MSERFPGCSRARHGGEDEDCGPGVGTVLLDDSNLLPAPGPVDYPAFGTILLGREVLGERPTQRPQARSSSQTVGSSGELAMVAARAAAARGRRSTAGIKASRTASAHASLRSMRWTLTRALPLTPMTAQEPPRARWRSVRIPRTPSLAA